MSVLRQFSAGVTHRDFAIRLYYAGLIWQAEAAADHLTHARCSGLSEIRSTRRPIVGGGRSASTSLVRGRVKARPLCFVGASEGVFTLSPHQAHDHYDAERNDQMQLEARQLVLELHARRSAGRWVRELRHACDSGLGPAEIDELFGTGAFAFHIATVNCDLPQAIAKRVRDTDPCRAEFQNPFFDGAIEEVEAHNREVRRQSALQASMPSRALVPLPIFRPTKSRPRQQRGVCSSRIRGSRRGTCRSHSRGGDSGDDPGGEPEPGSGPLDEFTILGAGR
jgi:hypothetical protein